jgi:hypothetical protein
MKFARSTDEVDENNYMPTAYGVAKGTNCNYAINIQGAESA